MTGKAESLNQAKHELERQKFKLQKELVGFEKLFQDLQTIDARARQGDATALRQFKALEKLAKDETGKQMQYLIDQLNQLHIKYSKLVKMKGSIAKERFIDTKHDAESFDGKIKKKRRTRIKYL